METVKVCDYPTWETKPVTSELTPVEWKYHTGFRKIKYDYLFGLDNWNGTVAWVSKTLFTQIITQISPQSHGLTFCFSMLISNRLPTELQIVNPRWKPASSSTPRHLSSTERASNWQKNHLSSFSVLLKVKQLPWRNEVLEQYSSLADTLDILAKACRGN